MSMVTYSWLFYEVGKNEYSQLVRALLIISLDYLELFWKIVTIPS